MVKGGLSGDGHTCQALLTSCYAPQKLRRSICNGVSTDRAFLAAKRKLDHVFDQKHLAQSAGFFRRFDCAVYLRTAGTVSFGMDDLRGNARVTAKGRYAPLPDVANIEVFKPENYGFV